MYKDVRLIVITAALLLALALGNSNVFAASDPFIGSWESIDSDGSYQILTIGGGPGASYHVRYYDYGATICGLGPGGEFLYAASAQGVITDSGSGLTGTLAVYCRSSPPTFWGNADFHFGYNAATDTLTDGFGITWTRK